MAISPFFTTSDSDLVAACMALIERFGHYDSAQLRKDQEAFAGSQGSKDGDEMAAIMNEVMELTTQDVDRLVAERLVANDRKVPLLREADANLVVRRVSSEMAKETEGGLNVDELMTVMEMARPYASMAIALHIAFLSAIDEDMYVAFWRFVAVLFGVALETGLTPLQAVASLEVRNAVYRSCMTPASWQKRSKVFLAVISGISPSALLSGVTQLASDDVTALKMESDLLAIDTQFDATGIMESQRKKLKAYFAARSREIWPAA